MSSIHQDPSLLRAACREGEFRGQTSGQCPGYAQANLCILPKEYAYDFLLFCVRNPKPCPLLHVLEEGQSVFGGINICTDLPKYRLYRHGVLVKEEEEGGGGGGGGGVGDGLTDVSSLWRSDLVTFVIGCSFSFEEAMSRAGLPLRHVELGLNVPMYNTNIACEPAGVFSGPLVVSMRPMTPAQSVMAVQITSRYPRVHGAPVHIGDPATIGIADIARPDYGDAVPIAQDEVCVFWACGVTPQAVVMKSKPSLCITHAPGCMLVLDQKNDSLSL